MRCTPFKVIKRVELPSSFHVTFVLLTKFVCFTHLFFRTLIYRPYFAHLEGVKRILFCAIPSELDERVVFFSYSTIIRADYSLMPWEGLSCSSLRDLFVTDQENCLE